MRILLTGASGQLGAYLIDRLVRTDHEIVAWSGTERASRRGIPMTRVDLTDALSTQKALDACHPDALIHAAAISAAEAVRLDPVGSWAVNVDATRRLADWAGRHDRRLVFTSTDLVFDGSRPWNREEDPAEPIMAYGRTKRDAEPDVMAASRGIVARLCLLYGPSVCGRPSFFDRAIEAIRAGQTRSFFADEYRTPLDLASAAEILVRLVESELTGLYHVAGPERVSRHDLMSRAAIALGLDPTLVKAGCRADAGLPEPRPADVSLDTTKLAKVFPELQRPSIEAAIRATSSQ